PGRLRVGVTRGRRRGAGRDHRARREASRGTRGTRLRRGRPLAPRDRSGRLGGARRRRRVSARTEVTRDQVYGRRAVREALRGRREVLELWATERAQKAEPWLRAVERPRVQAKL